MTGGIKGDTPLIPPVSKGFHPSGLPKTVKGEFLGSGHSHLRECRALQWKGPERRGRWIPAPDPVRGRLFAGMTGREGDEIATPR